jgi:hypothetical protein
VSNEYDGLGWNNFYSLDGINFSNGYRAGMASGPNVAYNGSGNPDTINSPSPFNLLSLDLAAAWLDGMAVTIDAYNGSSLAYSTTVYPSATAATLYTLNFDFVTSVSFSSAGKCEGDIHLQVPTAFEERETGTWAILFGTLLAALDPA